MKNKEVVISNVSIDENYIITKDNKKMYIYNNKKNEAMCCLWLLG